MSNMALQVTDSNASEKVAVSATTYKRTKPWVDVAYTSRGHYGRGLVAIAKKYKFGFWPVTEAKYHCMINPEAVFAMVNIVDQKFAHHKDFSVVAPLVTEVLLNEKRLQDNDFTSQKTFEKLQKIEAIKDKFVANFGDVALMKIDQQVKTFYAEHFSYQKEKPDELLMLRLEDQIVHYKQHEVMLLPEIAESSRDVEQAIRIKDEKRREERNAAEQNKNALKM